MTSPPVSRVTHPLAGPGFGLRPAREEDQSLITSFIRNEHLNPLSLNWRHFWLAEMADGEVIACGQVKPHGDGSRELASLVVLPPWREQGVAAALIAKLQVEGGRPLWLTCRSGLAPFYERFGFVDMTRSDSLPPYFRRIRGLADVFIRLAQGPGTSGNHGVARAG